MSEKSLGSLEYVSSVGELGCVGFLAVRGRSTDLHNVGHQRLVGQQCTVGIERTLGQQRIVG